MMLGQRLLACAGLVREGRKVCDVGTDHAYLPCHLVLSGFTGEVTAADVNEHPLESAVRTIASCGLEGRVRTLLSDGLEQVEPDTDDVVIAGMGGELIARIVFASRWIRDPEKRLILQPMTNAGYLRRELYREGFEILREVPVSENGHYYTVMLCAYCGRTEEVSPLFALLGKIPEEHSEAGEEHINYQKQRMEKIAKGLLRSKEEQKRREAGAYFSLIEEINERKAIR